MKNNNDLFWALPGMRIKAAIPTRWLGIEKLERGKWIWLKGKL